ncbi:Uncharacterized conserved protein YndB, AHSA1/START domain [Saccharopolyspora kobensis]|uniref:Uncharacterized conserved protein YndB, AHSA1/START domain n=2 Tax=Saccharopolyspora kobensis TaxID=146035 RepID=A0A1H6C9B6_9PSEU|nr:Uncharacterized conserved protein YndB, AHSA1/START domain [Saccharopolyspora kobensis]SFC33031.1 Uncharacterized conserved protein YndB, AHSA1/START domain [Saccharopolyspora kobensis]
MIHGMFSVERDFAAPVERVWAGYADPEIRSRWHLIPGRDSRHELDFRVGGSESLTGSFAPTGTVEQIANVARFHDIVDGERIVASYEAVVNGVLRWVSLLTLEFAATTTGTLLTHTEQYAFLAWTGDGADDVAHLKGSIPLRLNALAGLVEP